MRTYVSVGCAVAVVALLGPGPAAAQDEPLEIPAALYLESVRYAIEQTEVQTLSGDHFAVVGDPDAFLAAVGGWVEGVVVDPEYLRHADVAPYFKSLLFEQNIDMEGLTQPKGWTGTAQSIATPYELKYNGHVILREFEPTSPVTPFHEAIHAYTYAIEGGDIDLDSYGGPEYLSGRFRDHLSRLRRADAALCRAVDALLAGDDPQQEIAGFWRRVELVEEPFRKATEAPQVLELLAAMGGRADWEGYREQAERSLRLAGEGDAEAVEVARCDDGDAASAYRGDIPADALHQRPSVESRTALAVEPAGDGSVTVTLDVHIRTAYENRVGCMKGGGTVANVALADDGSFSTTIPASLGFRDIPASQGEDPCEGMGMDVVPLTVTGTIDPGGSGQATLEWLSGPIPIELTLR